MKESPVNPKSIGSAIRSLREAKGFTRADVQAGAGVSPSALQTYETGQRKCPIDVLGRLATLFEVELRDILAIAAGAPVTSFVVPRETTVVREPTPPTYGAALLEGARWGYVRAAKELLDRALSEQFGADDVAPPLTAAAIARELGVDQPAKPARRARGG